MVSLVTYNVNGIRAAIKKGLIDWIKESQHDIICIQETKSQPEQVDISELEALGYEGHWHSAEKKGYSGVLTLTKIKPQSVQIGMGDDTYDVEGRIVVTHFEDWSLVNVYIPSGTSGDHRHEYKMEFLQAFGPWIQDLKKKHPNLVIVGDYNVVHLEQDIHNPQRKDKPSGYRPDERAWLDDWFTDGGFTDAFRYKNPDKIQFSWWTYRAGARAKDKGWRIDYISVSEPMVPSISECSIHKEIFHSDHCPVICRFDI